MTGLHRTLTLVGSLTGAGLLLLACGPSDQPPAGSPAGSSTAASTGTPSGTQSGTPSVPGTSGTADPQRDTRSAQPGLSPAVGGAAGQGPRIACDAPLLDIGRVWAGSVTEHTFQLRSSGTEPVEVINVKPDCGCTAAKIHVVDPGTKERTEYTFGDPIPPGATFDLDVVYDTTNKHGRLAPKIRIYGNHAGGVTELTIQAHVAAFLELKPAGLNLGTVTKGNVGEASMTITSFEGKPIGLQVDPDTIPEGIDVELEPQAPVTDGRAATWVVKASGGPGLPKGQNTWRLRVFADVPNPVAPPDEDGSQPPFHVTPWLSANVLGSVSASPAGVTFGVVKAEETVSTSFRLTCHDPDFVLGEPKVFLRPLQEGEAQPIEETMQITTRPVDGENAWDVEILLEGLADDVGSTFSGWLVVETGHPEDSVLELKLSGIRKRQGG